MFSSERSRDSFLRFAWKTVETNGTAVALMYGNPHHVT